MSGIPRDNVVRLAAAYCLTAAFAVCDPSPVARNAGPGIAYVGSEACGTCHSAVLEGFRKTGMGRSIRVPDIGVLVPNVRWNGRRLTSEKLNRTFEAFARDGHLYQSESRTDGTQEVFRTIYRLEYAIGSGAHGISFIARRGDRLFQAPLSFYART